MHFLLKQVLLLLTPLLFYLAVLPVQAMQAVVPDEQEASIEPEQLFKSYQERYAQAAEQAANAKHDLIDDQGLSKRQGTAAKLARSGGPGKNKIKTQLNPILDELHEALIPTHEEIVAVDQGLSEDRQALLTAGFKEKEITRIERVVNLYLVCDSSRDREIIAENHRLRPELTTVEADAIDLCNLRRLLLGMNPLKIDMKLVAASRDHSKDMVEHKFFSHTSPVEGKRRFTKRANNFGTSASAENIAKGYDNGWNLFKGWWESPGHLKNMMRGAKRVGIGQHKKHYTMMIGG